MALEYVIIVSVISVVGTVLGIVFGAKNIWRNQRIIDKEEIGQIARMSAKLDHIDDGISSVKHDMADIKADIKEQRERVVRVEESAKQAHKRLDELVDRKRGSNA